MSEQPNIGPAQTQQDNGEQVAVAESWTARHPHVRTDEEIAVDDALGSSDDPH